MTSDDIKELLAIKHFKEIFVTECKNGPSMYGSHCRMDAWAMHKSWSNPKYIAYEIKVSRSDFLNDNKWQHYLLCCNELYFVCPKGLILPDELPKEVGLLYVTGNGLRLITKKKAAYRTIDVPEDVLKYILMWRAKIEKEHKEKPREEIVKEYVERANRCLEVGQRLSTDIAVLRTTLIKQLEDRTQKAESIASKLESFKKICDDIGISVDSDVWYFKAQAEKTIKEFLKIDVISQLERILVELKKLHKNGGKE
jgi:hypothetical protein